MKLLSPLLLPLLLATLPACDRAGVAHIEISNTQGFLMPAREITIGPGVDVIENKVRPTHGGMDLEQTITVHGPIMIVPAPDPRATLFPHADFSSPAAVYQSYLQAIKSHDLPLAASCWNASNNDEVQFTQVMAGMWIESHRLASLIEKKFPAEINQLKDLMRADCTTPAIDRTLERLALATTTTRAESGEIAIPWEKDDGSENPAFMHGDEPPVHCRKVANQWRLDFKKSTGNTKPEQLLAPGTWGSAFRDGTNAMREINDALERGTIRTPAELRLAITEKMEAVGKKYKSEHRDPKFPQTP